MRAQPVLLAAAIAAVLVACDNMANQPKRLPYELPYGAESTRWPALPPVGSVARDDSLGAAPIPAVTIALLQRGQQRFDIYCAPCHSRAGDGDGIIVHRGFPRPP